MLNYLLNKNYKNYSKFKNSSNNNNTNINKKNSLSNIRQKKLNLNLVHPKNKKKNDMIEALNNNKNGIKFTNKIINELYKKERSSEENKLKIKMHKTNTNSPIKKINFNRYPSYKKLTNNNDSFHLSLKNNKYNNYNYNINKSKINHNSSLSNNINITNNNVTTTNFTNSINNTAVSVTNNNSYNISNKNNKKIKENQAQNQDIIKINLKILYKDIFYNVELDQFHDGLWLAKNINEYFDINLNDYQIKNLAKELTNQINNVINCIVNFTQEKNFGAVININKILENDKDLKKQLKYKIVVKYNKEKYYFFINNNNDINEMVDIIIYNIIKNEKYDCLALKNELIKKINISFGISDYKNNFINDLSN